MSDTATVIFELPTGTLRATISANQAEFLAHAIMSGEIIPTQEGVHVSGRHVIAYRLEEGDADSE